MSNKVVFSPEFLADVTAQTKWIAKHMGQDAAERLFQEIERASDLLSRLPLLGAVEDVRDGIDLRRLVLRELPFVLWYVFEKRKKRVIVLHLFYWRQKRRK